MNHEEDVQLFLGCLSSLNCDILEYYPEFGLSFLDEPARDIVASINVCVGLNLDNLLIVLESWLANEDRGLTVKIIDETNVDWIADEESEKELKYILSKVVSILNDEKDSAK